MTGDKRKIVETGLQPVSGIWILALGLVRKFKILLFIAVVSALCLPIPLSAGDEAVCLYINANGALREALDMTELLDEIEGMKVIPHKDIEAWARRNGKQVRNILNSADIRKLADEYKAQYAVLINSRILNGWLEGDIQLYDIGRSAIIESMRVCGDMGEVYAMEQGITCKNALWTIANAIVNRKKPETVKIGIIPFYDDENGEKYGRLGMEMTGTYLLEQTGGMIMLAGDVFPDYNNLSGITAGEAKEIGERLKLDYVCFGKVKWNPDKMGEPPLLDINILDVRKGKITGQVKKEFLLLKEMREVISSMDISQEYFVNPVWQYSAGISVPLSVTVARTEVGLTPPEKDGEEDDMERQIDLGVDYEEKERDIVVIATDPIGPFDRPKWTKGKKSAPTTCGIIALDGASGERIWLSPTAVIYTPQFYDTAKWLFPGSRLGITGDAVLYADNEGTICAISSDAGILLWKTHFGGIVGPVASNETETSPFNKGGIQGESVGEGALVAAGFNLRKDEVKGFTGEDILVAGNSAGELIVIDAKTGRQQWKKRISGAGIQATPALYDGVIYVGANDHYLYAIDAKTGLTLWKFVTKSPIYAKATVIDDSIYFGGMDRNLYCLDKTTGTEIWKLAFESTISSDIIENTSPLVGGDASIDATPSLKARMRGVTSDIIFTTNEGIIHCISLINPPTADSRGFLGHPVRLTPTDTTSVSLEKKQKWEYKMPAWTSSSPIVYKDNVFASCQDGYVYQVAVSDGKFIAKYRAGGRITGSPGIVDTGKQKLLVVCNRDGVISAFPVK